MCMDINKNNFAVIQVYVQFINYLKHMENDSIDNIVEYTYRL